MGAAYMIKSLTTIKNVECPYCGYLLPMIYDENTNVSGLLVRCKGRNCKESFVLNIKRGIQQGLPISDDIVEAYKKVFGADYIEHLQERYG
jgi:hypothetical protein